jgi:hypothetical protein
MNYPAASYGVSRIQNTGVRRKTGFGAALDSSYLFWMLDSGSWILKTIGFPTSPQIAEKLRPDLFVLPFIEKVRNALEHPANASCFILDSIGNALAGDY